MNGLRWLAIAGLSLLCVSGAAAQNYPTRPVTIVVPMRQAAAPICSPAWSRKNSSSSSASHSSSRIDRAAAPSSPADRRRRPMATLLMGTSTPLAINATLHRSTVRSGDRFRAARARYNVPFVLVVNPSQPIKSASDLVKLAKEARLAVYGTSDRDRRIISLPSCLKA